MLPCDLLLLHRLPAPDLSQRPVLLGIDCEMCATSENDKELLALAVVDEAGNTLVRVSSTKAAAAMLVTIAAVAEATEYR